jgi:hypothetical protein
MQGNRYLHNFLQFDNGKGKGKVYPGTSYEGLEGVEV